MRVLPFRVVVNSDVLDIASGKRRNVLQNRTDDWDYDLDQLLLGTILFTLNAFLFPTVLVYYLFFALVSGDFAISNVRGLNLRLAMIPQTRLAIIAIHATLETFLAFMNHFPLFAIMLRLKDPSRMPGMFFI